MSMISNIWYTLRWPLYGVAVLLHYLYQFTVFLSKPGARLIVAYIAHAITLWIHVQHQGLPIYPDNFSWDTWYDETIRWLTYDAAARGPWIYLDIPLLVCAFCLHFFPSDVLRAALGLFPAKSRPLPPMRRVQAPKLKIKTVKVRRAIKRLRRPWLPQFYNLERRLPEPVARILSQSKSSSKSSIAAKGVR